MRDGDRLFLSPGAVVKRRRFRDQIREALILEMIGNYLQSLGLSDKYLQIINKKLKETAQTVASRTSRIF